MANNNVPNGVELPVEAGMDTIEPNEDLDLKNGSEGFLQKFRKLVGGSKE